ncbi:heme ABC exporter ATP-binding protein CcmA [Acidocella sp.]|uniref:heme ABC exporter ATP-binding protein CcmA n=1 Tax=Acidocella sp. TaxID=50710 RepID=UPI0026106A16|nr:heme ABC exporter ATP-binding protein CcmA [Acidocella sp.]MDD2795525.1 heme ABC exporter ATP-binding protein CcmA [Acidocella sp.]
MLSASNLSVFRGERLVLTNISFSLSAGGILVLRGANGAGKSTLLRALAGLTPLAAGVLKWDGEDALHDLPSHAKRIAWLGHLDAVKPALTAAEHVPLAALAPVGLTAYANLPARLLSAGQKRRLAIARVAASGKPLWLLDEPTTGLDAASLTRFSALCESHRQGGGMIIASTHTPLELTGVSVLSL